TRIYFFYYYQHKLVHCKWPDIFTISFSYSNLLIIEFFVTYYNQIRNFSHRGFTDLVPYLLVVGICFRPYTGAFERLMYLPGIDVMSFCNCQDRHLYRSKPERENTCIMLNKNTEKAFQ